MKPIEFRGKETMSYNKAEHPLPPAEGAEEYLKLPQNDGKLKYCPAHFFPTLIQLMEGFAALHAHNTVQRCPVCDGKGLVPNCFYATTSGIGSTTQTYLPEKCRTCNGAGVILPPYIHAQKIADKMVSERLREELIAFLDKRDHTITLSRLGNIEAVDEYLKQLTGE